MKKKHLVVQGAICMCNFGTLPDRIKVLTNKKEYANDSEGKQKLIASHLDIGSPFQIGSFGSCAKLLGGTCKSVVLMWSEFYEKTTLYTGGKILLETSKATCPIGGPDCIQIIHHGQQAGINKQNLLQAKPEIQRILNPAVDIEDVLNNETEVI